MPCASTERGDSASDLARCQLSGSVQAGPLEANFAAEEPITCTQSTESFIHPSQLVEHQEVHTETAMYYCPECNLPFLNSTHLKRHRLTKHHLDSPYKCTECNKHFGTADRMSQHGHLNRNVEKAYKCSECNEMVKNAFELRRHQLLFHYAYDAKGFTVDEALDFPWEGRE